MKTRIVVGLVVGLSACSASQEPDGAYREPDVAYREAEHLGHHACLHHMGVWLDMRDGRPVVHVQHNCTENLPALVHDINILDYIPPQWEPTGTGELPLFAPPHCQLQANMIRSGEGDFPASGWAYGDQMAGYTVLRDCKPLQTGRRYSASVIGSGVGGVEFEIRSDGGFDIFGSDCGL